jgi:VanZ family protein
MRKAGIAAGWGWAAAIVWLSLTPSPPQVDLEHGDKLGHFAAYGLLMFWFAQLYPERKARIAYVLGFIAMGIGVELLQGQLGYRTYEVFDMYANTLGVLLGWVAGFVLPRIRFL